MQSTGVQSTAVEAASQCFLPLKKRQHRNLPSEDAASHHHHHSHQMSKAKGEESSTVTTTQSRPESSLSQSSNKSASKRSTSTSTTSTGTSTSNRKASSKAKPATAAGSKGEVAAPVHTHWTSELVTTTTSSTASSGQSHTVAPLSCAKRTAVSTAHAEQKHSAEKRAEEKTVLLLRSHSQPPSQARTNTTVGASSPSISATTADAGLKGLSSSSRARSRSRKKTNAPDQKDHFGVLSEGEQQLQLQQSLPASTSSLSPPIARRVSSPITGSRSKTTPTPDGRRKQKSTKVRKGPASPLSVHGSSVDESSDADDEFDSDDEIANATTTNLLEEVSKKSCSSAQATTLPKQQQQQQQNLHCDSHEMAKKQVKPVRINGVHKSIEEKVKVKHNSRLVGKQKKAVQVASTAEAVSNGVAKIRASKKIQKATTVPVQAIEKEQPSSALVASNSDSKAKAVVKKTRKRRRTINKTGFDKPRKRNRLAATTNKRGRPPLVSVAPVAVAITRKPSPKPNGVNGHSSQSDADEKVNKTTKSTINVSSNKSTMKKKAKNGSQKETLPASVITSDSCSTEIEDVPRKKKNKLKPKVSTKEKLTKRSHKKTEKPSDTSDSDGRPVISTSSSSTSSSEEDIENKSSIDNYPVFMVTKSSTSKTDIIKKKKKVQMIKSNPFTRPIPEKKYYKTAVYAKEFAEFHSEESETLKAFSSKVSTAPNNDQPVIEEAHKLPILPLPNFYKSPNQTSASSSSSPSSSSQEDEGSLSSGSGDSKRRKSLRSKKAKSPAGGSGNEDGVLQCLKAKSGFTLSFDIWFQYKYNPLPSAMSSANYRRVRQNVFIDTKPVANHCNQYCNCTVTTDDTSTACGANCINRLMYQECWEKSTIMQHGHKCSNQRIQRYEWSPGLERFMTDQRGWGIRTTESIKMGEFILEYIGEIVSDQLFERRMTERYRHDHHHYSMNIDGGMVIDGYRVANEGRFVNHSCEPNCEMQKWAVNGYYRMCMFALRDIEPDEELFYDYNFRNFNLDSQQTCHCGSSKCRGFIGGKRANAPVATDSGALIDADAVQPTDIAKESPNPAEKYLNKLLPLLCSNDKTWIGSLPKVKNRPQIEHDEACWIFANCKTAKIKMPISQYESNILGVKHNLNRALKQVATSSQGSVGNTNNNNSDQRMVEISYDPNLLKAFKKVKPLGQKSRAIYEKRPSFLMRNYRNMRRYYTGLCNAVPSSSGKAGLDLNQNPYAKHKSVNYRSSSSGNSSESETNDSHVRRRSTSAKELNNLAKDSAEMVSRMVQQVKIFSDTCSKTSTFMKNKLVSLLSNGKFIFCNARFFKC